MKKNIKRDKAKEKIESFFSNIKNKTPKEIKKIRRLAMSHNIKLKAKRKLFCQSCFSPLNNTKIRIKKGLKAIKCLSCGNVMRWKIG